MNRTIRDTGLAFALCALLGGPLYGCGSTPEHRSTGQVIDDATITTKVKAKLLDDPTTHGLKIDVDTSRGVVELSGNVGSATEQNRAIALARSVDGVRGVRNDLIVR